MPLFSISQSNITGVVAMPFTTIDVSIISGTVTSFSITPALPIGLALNTTTGSISGTPIQASASKIYTISGSNSDGIGTASFTLFIDGDLDGDGIGDTTDLDADNDGIPDAIEKGSNGATPIDTDNDGTPDYRDIDSDNDGISDAIEKGPNGANPIDSDGDGIPDYRDIPSAITDLDIDGDGVTAAQEALDGTDPNNSCSSITSSITMPLKPSFLEGDCDGDGLTNGQELGLNPTQPTDIDNNGTPDYLEFNNHSASEDDLEVFNSITNNSDNLNDAFIIRGIENYPDNTLYIYNRWGVEVYSVEGYAQDNKYFRGISEGHRTISQSAELPKGTYYYVLRYVNKQGIEKQRTGYLYITK
jgi:gliding motility-associated-like protein